MVYIGIDGGKQTGVAIWGGEPKQLLVRTVTFWGCVDLVRAVLDFKEIPNLGLKVVGLTIVIEDVTKNKPTFRRRGQREGVIDRMAQNVGSVKRETELLIERFEQWGLTVKRVPPSKKLSAATFKRWTGYTGRTSQHARDAAMLVWGML